MHHAETIFLGMKGVAYISRLRRTYMYNLVTKIRHKAKTLTGTNCAEAAESVVAGTSVCYNN